MRWGWYPRWEVLEVGKELKAIIERRGHRRADDQFAIERIGFRIIEGDDVGGAFVLQMRLVHFSHALGGYKGD